MGIGSELQVLGRFLDDCERSGEAVDSIDLSRVTDAGESRLTAELELRLSVDLSGTNGVRLCDPRIGPDGILRFALDSTRELIPETDHDVVVEQTDATLEDERVVVSLEATVPATAARRERAGISRSSTDATALESPTATDGSTPFENSSSRGIEPARGTADGETRSGSPTERDRDVPPFKNPDLLAEVYESCETFAEMADELDMEVTAETVRRYMIDYDIHEPNTYQTGGTDATDTAGGDDGQPVVLSDGIGLPDDVTVDTLIETVKRSNTIYEVTQDMDLDRDDALEMLQELNLLDIVMGRLATEGERDITREDIVERLRDASAVQ